MLASRWLLLIIHSSLLSWEIVASSESGCKLVTPNDREERLKKKLEPLYGKTLEVTVPSKEKEGDVQYKYQMGICVDAVNDGKHQNVGMLQTKLQDGDQRTVGLYNATQLMGGDNWILLKYKDGQKYNSHCMFNNVSMNRQAHIMIVCDPDIVMGELQMIEENKDVMEECYYLFQINSKIACTFKEEGLSAGSVFCIIFFIFVLIYLIIGFLYQRIVVGAKGLEQIPNFSFWREFGKLQADGCDFLCRCGERQEMKMYRGIDDQLLNTERREEPDDHLLSM